MYLWTCFFFFFGWLKTARRKLSKIIKKNTRYCLRKWAQLEEIAFSKIAPVMLILKQTFLCEARNYLLVGKLFLNLKKSKFYSELELLWSWKIHLFGFVYQNWKKSFKTRLVCSLYIENTSIWHTLRSLIVAPPPPLPPLPPSPPLPPLRLINFSNFSTQDILIPTPR